MVFQKTDRLAEKNRRADKAEEVEDEETDKHIDNTYSRSENTQTLVIYRQILGFVVPLVPIDRFVLFNMS